MRKFLCLLFCFLGCSFTFFWAITYIFSCTKEYLPEFMSAIMWINVAIILFSVVIGFGVIRISIDEWFQNSENDTIALKDRVLIIVVSVITVICVGLFILTIIYNNVNSIRVDELDNMKLRILMFILANTYVSFAYYQHFQVAKSLK